MSTADAPEAPRPAPPQPAKTVWTNADFDDLTWHDNTIHALAVEPLPGNPGRLLLDIDHIVEGVRAYPAEATLSFWICPATLVFSPAWDLVADTDMEGWGFHLAADRRCWPVTDIPTPGQESAVPCPAGAGCRCPLAAAGRVTCTSNPPSGPVRASAWPPCA